MLLLPENTFQLLEFCAVAVPGLIGTAADRGPHRLARELYILRILVVTLLAMIVMFAIAFRDLDVLVTDDRWPGPSYLLAVIPWMISSFFFGRWASQRARDARMRRIWAYASSLDPTGFGVLALLAIPRSSP